MKRTLGALTLLLVGTTLSAAAFLRHGAERPALITQAVTRGSLVTVIAATGTLEPVTTVQVGTQVSGTIESLGADFNSIVRKGQVVARLDQSLYRTAVEQARANLVQAEANVDRLLVASNDAAAALTRAQALAARQLIPATDLETAQATARSADAQVRSARAQVTQARAGLDQAEVNLGKTIISSPIDGIVIARSVDVGQTVAASLQAPTLFEIAADLREMQLNASIDEADVGRVAAGQTVSFTVDAYPGLTFTGTLEQVRLNPVVSSNVVTYAAIVSAPNPDLNLKPGMTANLSIHVARRDDVLRVPTAALQFRPGADVLRAYNAAPLSSAGARPDVKMAWVDDGGTLRAVAVKVGASDDTFTEVLEGSLPEGARVATRVGITAPAPTAGRASSGNPLIPSGPRPR
jgi:HlyD family secretion protein